MKKILFLIGSLRAGGAERVATNLCNDWCRDNNVLLVTGDSDKNDFYNIENSVRRISLDFRYDIKGIGRLLLEQISRSYKILKLYFKEKPDTIVVSCSDISLRILLTLFFSQKKIIVCEHNNYFALQSKVKRALRIIIFRKASKLLLLTERDIKNYTDRGFPRHKILVMRNPLGIEKKSYHRKKLNKSLLAVGRLCEQKAFDRLIDIVPKIDPEAVVNIVGEGSLRSSLEQKIIDNKLEARVKLIGSTKEIQEYYANSSILLMTSKYEGLPMVIGEANSFGLPVVAYDCPTGPSEMIDNDVNGFLIRDGDEVEFSERVNELLANKAKYYEMSERSHMKALDMSITNITKQWYSIL